jgi:hypothetical protein
MTRREALQELKKQEISESQKSDLLLLIQIAASSGVKEFSFGEGVSNKALTTHLNGKSFLTLYKEDRFGWLIEREDYIELQPCEYEITKIFELFREWVDKVASV